MQIKREAPRRIQGTLMIKNRSRRWLATQCGFKSHSYINRIINGMVTTVTADTAISISAALDIPLDDLFLPRNSGISGHAGQRTRSAA